MQITSQTKAHVIGVPASTHQLNGKFSNPHILDVQQLTGVPAWVLISVCRSMSLMDSDLKPVHLLDDKIE